MGAQKLYSTALLHEHTLLLRCTQPYALFMEGQSGGRCSSHDRTERVCGKGISQHGAVSELEVDGYRVGRCAPRFYVFTVTTTGNHAAPGIVGVIAGIGALWLFRFRCELLSISMESQTLTMPTRQMPWMPAFASRDQRRRFIGVIQSICPGVAVYRIRSPSD